MQLLLIECNIYGHKDIILLKLMTQDKYIKFCIVFELIVQYHYQHLLKIEGKNNK